jgi:hypothetical protein
MNAADKEQVRQRERQKSRAERQVVADWKTVLATPEGRRLFNWILSELQPRVQLWNANSALQGFNCARHDVGTWIKDQIDEADPAALVTMFTEHQLQIKQESSEREALRVRKKKTTEPEVSEE